MVIFKNSICVVILYLLIIDKYFSSGKVGKIQGKNDSSASKSYP